MQKILEELHKLEISKIYAIIDYIKNNRKGETYGKAVL